MASSPTQKVPPFDATKDLEIIRNTVQIWFWNQRGGGAQEEIKTERNERKKEAFSRTIKCAKMIARSSN
jgi:hypothetical protein